MAGMDVDAVFQQLGNFGPRQKANFVLYSLATMIAPIHLIAPALTVGQPDDYCCIPPPGFTSNETVPFIEDDEGGGAYDRCHLYQVREGQVTSNLTSCLYGWEYQSTHGETSVVTDLDLVCEKDLHGGTVQSLAHVGILLGCLVLSQLADTYGRRKALLCSLLGLGVCGTAASFVWDYYLLAVFFFTTGVWTGGVTTISYVRVIEMFTTQRRMKGHTVNGLMFGCGVLMVSPLAYLLPNWRHFQLASSLPCFLLFTFTWFCYESIRWLVQKGRYKEAEELIIKIAESNKIPTSGLLNQEDKQQGWVPLENLDQKVAMSKDETDAADGNSNAHKGYSPISINGKSTPCERNRHRRYSAVHLFTTRSTATQTLILFLCWFTANVVYFGFLINTSNLAGHKYLKFLLMALFELPCYPIDFFTMKRFGRKRPLITYFLGSTVVCITVAFLPRETASGVSLVPVIIAVAAIGRYFAAAVFNILYLVSAEVFPTVLRNIGLGTCFTVGKLGSAIAPFIVYLNTIFGWLPLTIFGAVSLASGLLVPFLPETRHTHLPETFNDGVKLADKGRRKPEPVPEWT